MEIKHDVDGGYWCTLHLLKEERQAHAKASQQQLDKHAVELQDEQQRTTSATAFLTPLENQVQV